MQREIKQIFLDNNDNIYVTDDNNVLYFYDGLMYHPFLEPLGNIHNCFFMGDRFFVHHTNTISVFDEDLNLVNLCNSWITDKIDKVCYCKENNTVATLEQGGKVHVYFGVSHNPDQNNDEDVTMASISHAFKSNNGEKYIGYQIFQDIKIVNDILLTFNEGIVKIFHLKKHKFVYIASIVLKKQFYDEIYDFNLMQNIFTLSSGSQFYLNKKPNIHNIQEKNFSHFEIFKQHNIYFWLKDNNLYFYYRNDNFYNIVRPIISILQPELNIEYHDKSDYCCDKVELSGVKSMVNVINGKSMQIISINNENYLINKKLTKISFSDELIFFDSISELTKCDANFIIDIENNSSILDQLINIIPNLYRLNNDFIYEFHQVSHQGDIISFGEGSTRHCFNYLRNEIDAVLQKKFESYDEQFVNRLGKLFYFCYVEGQVTFYNIDPYFFYLLSEKTDHLTLLKIFKGNDFDLYHKQYLEYHNDISKLSELDIGVETIDQYMHYLFSANLTSTQQSLYKSFVKGFSYFATRNKSYKFIKRLPLIYYIKMLTSSNFIDIDFEFSNDGNISNEIFEIFCDIFNDIFYSLTKENMLIFLQNVTGSQYYHGTVHVVIACTNTEFLLEQLIHDEITRTDLISNDILTNFNIQENNTSVLYEISTCNTELIINIIPSRINIKEILRLLTIEDLNMKN